MESLEVIQHIARTDNILQSLVNCVLDETAFHVIPERFQPILSQFGITQPLQDIWILFGNSLIAVAGNESLLQMGSFLFFKLRQYGFISFDMGNSQYIELEHFNLPQIISEKFGYCLLEKPIDIEKSPFVYSICDQNSAFLSNSHWFEESSSIISEVR